MAGQFHKKLTKFEAQAMVQVDQVRRASILEMFSIIVDATPVDEGFLKGAWQCTVNSPATAHIHYADKTGASVTAKILQNMGKLVDVVYFTNNMPYAYRIEFESWSAQAKGGMVRPNVLKWKTIVANKAKEFIK